MVTIGIFLGLSAWVVYLCSQSVFRVEEGHLGVLTSFGAPVLIDGQLKTFRPGLHTRWPWQRVQCTSMKEQALELRGEKEGSVVLADDGTLLRIDSHLRFQPRLEGLRPLLFDLERPEEHLRRLFACLVRNEIANFSGETTAKPDQAGGSYAILRRERKNLNAHIESYARKEVEAAYGVHFSAVDLVDIVPPEEVGEALNAVMQAQSEAEADFARAEAECQQRTLAAEHAQAIAVANGRAVETEIRTIGAHLETLEKSGTLADYVARREAEVLLQAKTVYVRSER
jgi:regulator of protease activity HflC (stomatin/prohibitin superfamily)